MAKSNSESYDYLGVNAQVSHVDEAGTHFLGQRGKLLADAAGYLLERNKAQAAIFVTGNEKQPIADLMAKRVGKRGRTIVTHQTKNTLGEVQAFLELAKAHDKKLIGIADDLHVPVVKRVYASQGRPDVYVHSSAKVIEVLGTEEDRKRLKDLRETSSQFSLGLYQWLVREEMNFDKNYRLFNWLGERGRKGHVNNPWPLPFRWIMPTHDPVELKPAPALLRPLVKFFQ